MLDKDRYLTDLNDRNAIRREYQLPLLDIPSDFDFEIYKAESQFSDKVKNHENQRLVIREQVVADLKEQFGENFDVSCTNGRYAVGSMTQKRFDKFLQEHGIIRPRVYESNHKVTNGGKTEYIMTRHLVIYDEGKETVIVENKI